MDKIYILVAIPYNYVKFKCYDKWLGSLRGSISNLSFKSVEKRKYLLNKVYKPTNKGYFKSISDAEKVLLENISSDCGYYSHFCIEESSFGFSDVYGEPVRWYKELDNKFLKCKRPKWSKGIFGFSN